MTSRTFDARTGTRAFFKCENFQRMGAFKFRGAYNALSRLTPEERRRGVVAFSSGNHAQAVALAGQLLGIPAAIVMPADAPAVKVAATKGYGAEVILYDRAAGQDREAFAAGIAAERGATLIPPFDHRARDRGAGHGGEGTAGGNRAARLAVRVLRRRRGCCRAAPSLRATSRRASRSWAWSPPAGDDATRSFRTKTLQRVENPQTIADGARTQSLGRLTFPLVLANVHDFLTVTDEELVEAMRFLWERMKLVVEPTGALATAGVLSGRLDTRGARVGVILSGGNVDLRVAAKLFA